MSPQDRLMLRIEMAKMLNKSYSQPMTATEQVKGGASVLPVVGDAISGYDAYQSFKQGNYGDAALNAIGVLPMIPALAGITKNANIAEALRKFSKSTNETSKPLYRGKGIGSSSSDLMMWASPDRQLAQGYANQRKNGTVDTVANTIKNVFSAGHDGRKITASKFAVEALAKSKEYGLIDDKKAMFLRDEFIKNQPMGSIEIDKLWADDAGKASVHKLLSSAGFDALHLIENGKDTYGVLRSMK